MHIDQVRPDIFTGSIGNWVADWVHNAAAGGRCKLPGYTIVRNCYYRLWIVRDTLAQFQIDPNKISRRVVLFELFDLRPFALVLEKKLLNDKLRRKLRNLFSSSWEISSFFFFFALHQRERKKKMNLVILSTFTNFLKLFDIRDYNLKRKKVSIDHQSLKSDDIGFSSREAYWWRFNEREKYRRETAKTETFWHVATY